MSDIQLYCNLMEDIKARILKTERMLLGHSPMRDKGLDTEVLFLLVRKILEQLAFSSLVAHKAAYSDVYEDFSKTWHIKSMTKRLTAIHPNFFPKPIQMPSVYTGPVKHMLDVKDGFLTLDDLHFLYDKCSDVLHTWNPFREGPRQVDIDRPIHEWVERIKRLLDVHTVQLAGSEDIWLIQMRHPADGKVHAYPCVNKGLINEP